MEKEGESYLDELLNTVAPDWEETSLSPEDLYEDFDAEAAGDISLEEALTVLDDLPDSEDEYYEEIDGGDGFDDLDGIGSILGLDSDIPPDPAENEGVNEEMPADHMPLPDSDDLPEIPVMKEVGAETTQAEPEEAPADEPEEASAAEPEETEIPADEPEPASEEEPDIPIEFEAILPDEEEPEPEAPAKEAEPAKKEAAAKDSVDVDDIFQDALSAVGYSGNDEDEDFAYDPIGSFMDGAEEEEEEVSTIPATDPMSPEKKKKVKKEKSGSGFFAKVFGNIVTDATAEEEERERQAEEAALAKKAKEKEEKKQKAEASKEEKAQLAQEEKERKKQLKAEQAAKKAEEKKEKKRLKAERKAEEEAHEVVGKINPVGAAVVVIFFATIAILTIFGSMLLSRNSNMSNAENLFASGDYMEAYDTINAANLVDEEDILYKRIRLCSQVQKEVNSFKNYTAMGKKLEALDSLVKGIRHYDLNLAEAGSLNITGQMENLKAQLVAGLNTDFGVSEEEARQLVAIADRMEYAKQLQEILNRS